jgi:hypothetical protein
MQIRNIIIVKKNYGHERLIRRDATVILAKQLFYFVIFKKEKSCG